MNLLPLTGGDGKVGQDGGVVLGNISNMFGQASAELSSLNSSVATLTTKAVKTVNVEDYGAIGDGITDNTTAIQNAINAVCGTDWITGLSGEVRFGYGTYLTRKIILRQGLKLIGKGVKATVIKDVAGDSNNALVVLGPQVMDKLSISDMSFIGVNNTNKMGWYFQGVLDTRDNLGGLTNSSFKNIEIKGFSGHAIWLRANTDTILGPMQLSTFENMWVERGSAAGARALLCTGQLDQMTFINGTFKTSGNSNEAAVEISREYRVGATVGGVTLPGSTFPDGITPPGTSANIMFLNTTIYSYDGVTFSSRGMIVEYTNAVALYNCWFENIPRPLEFRTVSLGCVVDGCAFLECGDTTSGTSWLVSCDSSSKISVRSATSINANATLTTNPFPGVLELRGYNFTGQTNTTRKILELLQQNSVNPVLKVQQDGTGPALNVVGKTALNGSIANSIVDINGASGVDNPSRIHLGDNSYAPTLKLARWTGSTDLYYSWVTYPLSNGYAIGVKTVSLANITDAEDPTSYASRLVIGINGQLGINRSPVTTAWLIAPASTVNTAFLNIPAGAAPSAPQDGDIWREDNTNTGLKIRVNGVTKTITLS